MRSIPNAAAETKMLECGRRGGAKSPALSGHSCSSACMLDQEHESIGHPLRQHPPSPRSIYDYGDDEDDAYDAVLLAPPTAYTLDRSTCYSPEPPSPLEDIPSSSHQRSLTASFLDKVRIPPIVTQTASRASLHSPTRTLQSFISPRAATPDEPPRSPTKTRANQIFSDWFTGSSAPVNLGLSTSPTREAPLEGEVDDYFPLEEMESAYTSRPNRGRTNTQTSQPAASGIASKLAWFTKGVSSPASTTSLRPSTSSSLDPSDDLLNLDITRALLPHGTPDILAPSSFNDLLTASEALLQRYQSAYRAKVSQTLELKAEKDAEKEELEEAETRARHLKMQLDGMAERAREQEEAMRALSLELLAERRRREDEERARRKSVQVVREKGSRAASAATTRRPTTSSGSVSDSGFESDADSAVDNESVGSSFGAAPTLAEDGYQGDSETNKPKIDRRLSTYDKVLKTVAGEPASAWAVMEGYREENRMLRGRVSELEDAVGNCLDMVACMGI